MGALRCLATLFLYQAHTIRDSDGINESLIDPYRVGNEVGPIQTCAKALSSEDSQIRVTVSTTMLSCPMLKRRLPPLERYAQCGRTMQGRR